MKKIILCLLGITLLGQMASAQKLKFGVQGGFNLANVQLDETGQIDYAASLRTAFNGGVFTQIAFLNDKLILQPEIMYSAEGFVNTLEEGTAGERDVKTNLNFMNIPVTVIFKPVKFLNFQFGPEFGYLLKAAAGGEKVTDVFNRPELGLNIGVGTTVARFINVNVRYNRGITKMYDGTAEELIGETAVGTSDGNVDLKNSMFQVSLGLNLSNLIGGKE